MEGLAGTYPASGGPGAVLDGEHQIGQGVVPGRTVVVAQEGEATLLESVLGVDRARRVAGCLAAQGLAPGGEQAIEDLRIELWGTAPAWPGRHAAGGARAACDPAAVDGPAVARDSKGNRAEAASHTLLCG